MVKYIHLIAKNGRGKTMSEYVNKRIEYINNWPNVSPFEAEANYKLRCDKFIELNLTHPFMPLDLWIDDDIDYNKVISHIIDSLDVMPYHPNFAFTFIFSAIDYYAKSIYPNHHGNPNTTISFKLMIDEFFDLTNQNNVIKEIIDFLFSAVPTSANIYLYKCLCSNLNPINKAYNRVVTDVNGNFVFDRKNIVDCIYAKYGYDPNNYNYSIRQPALLYRKIFKNDTIELNGTTIAIENDLKLHLLLSGIIYSLRNDSLHGSSMSSTKSSRTTPERYAFNFYCYLATYTLLMILLISKSKKLKPTDKSTKYEELKKVTTTNVSNFSKLFRNHI